MSRSPQLPFTFLRSMVNGRLLSVSGKSVPSLRRLTFLAIVALCAAATLCLIISFCVSNIRSSGSTSGTPTDEDTHPLERFGLIKFSRRVCIDCNATIQAYSEELGGLKEKLASCDASTQGYLDKFGGLRSKLENCTASTQGYLEKLGELRRKLASCNDSTQGYTEKLGILKFELANCNASSQGYLKKNGKLRKKLADCNATRQSYSDELARLRRELAKLKAESANLAPAESSIAGQKPIPLSLTIFTAPYPFTSSPSDPQRAALRSWLALTPPPRVVLLGNHPSFSKIAREFPEHVSVEPQIDSNSEGVPLFHSMVARAKVADTDFTALMSAHTVLSHAFQNAVQKAAAHFRDRDLFLVAHLFDLLQHPPNDVAGPKRGLKSEGAGSSGRNGSEQQERQLREHVLQEGILQQQSEVFIWNNPSHPLHQAVMPSFSYGRGSASAWLVNEVVTAGLREVVDITETAVAYELRVPSSPAREREDESGGLKRSQLRVWNRPSVQEWEVRVNRHLTHGVGRNFSAQQEPLAHAPWALMACSPQAPGGDDMCMVRRAKLSAMAALHETDTEDAVDGKLRNGGEGQLGRYRTLEEVLPQVADESKMVVLVAVTHPYFDMLMNFVCQLHSLNIPSPLVAAMDEGLYNLALQQGLPVYFEQGGDMLTKLKDRENCTFLTECFASTTKVKSRTVLSILKLGYSVLWTDVDIWWFQDPRPGFRAFGPGVLPIQSEEINGSLPANNRVNSGLYYARPEPKVVEAFEKIVARAAASPSWRSEQPNFDEELCGENKQQRRGDNECLYSNGLRVVFLDRSLHPNGYYKGIWFWPNVTLACETVGCETLHNNWLAGLSPKVDRFKKHKLWKYNEEERLCIHGWSAREDGEAEH